MDQEDEHFEADLEVGVQLLRELCQGFPHVNSLLREHEDDYDQVLGTVLLNEIGNWYVDSWLARDTHPEKFEEAQQFVARMAARFPHITDDEQNMLATGFLEALPNPGEPHRDAVEQLPEPLRKERADMDNPR